MNKKEEEKDQMIGEENKQISSVVAGLSLLSRGRIGSFLFDKLFFSGTLAIIHSGDGYSRETSVEEGEHSE